MDLMALGIQAYPTPGIIIPVWPVNWRPGDRPIYVYRPDHPANPKIKYYWPAGVQARLDLNPLAREWLVDPTLPVWFVEGWLKADALVSAGVCAIALLGTAAFGWKADGNLDLARDWQAIPDKAGRGGNIIFDSDAADNPNVSRDRRRLTQLISGAGFDMRAQWAVLPIPSSGKLGADDWLALDEENRSPEALEGLLREPKAAENLIVALKPDDIGHGQRLNELASDRLRWCYQHERWLTWTGRRWDMENQELANLVAHSAVREIQETVSHLPDTNQFKPVLMPIVGKLGSSHAISSMVKQGRSYMTSSFEEFDADPWLLNCANGVVDLRSGLLMAHDPRLLQQHMSPVPYEPEAECPEWHRFLDMVQSGDHEKIDFIRRAIGYCLTGLTNEQCYLVFTGEGGNGKGVLVRVLSAMLGDYAINLSGAALHKGRNSAQGFDIAHLPGKRLITSTETTTTDQLDEQRLKGLTGQEPFTAEHKFGKPFTFIPVGKLLLTVNGLPPTDDSSEGFWRRPAVVHFPNRYEPDQDPGLWARLEAELPGILADAVRACLEWQVRPLRPFPAAVTAAVREWKEEQDPLAPFLAECCEVSPLHEVGKRDLLLAYQQWVSTSGETPIKTNGRGAEWGSELRKHGMRASVTSEHGATWVGVKLKRSWEMAAQEAAQGGGSPNGRAASDLNLSQY